MSVFAPLASCHAGKLSVHAEELADAGCKVALKELLPSPQVIKTEPFGAPRVEVPVTLPVMVTVWLSV